MHLLQKKFSNILITFPTGYEIIGLEKVPDNGAALLVYYHGALPIDMYYIIAKMLLYKKRSLKNVVATFLFRLPGIFYQFFPSTTSFRHVIQCRPRNLKLRALWSSTRVKHKSLTSYLRISSFSNNMYIFAGFKIMLDVFGACSPTREECVKMLKVGLSLELSSVLGEYCCKTSVKFLQWRYAVSNRGHWWR